MSCLELNLEPEADPPPGARERPRGPLHLVARKGEAQAGLDVYLHLQAVEDVLRAAPPQAREERAGLLAGAQGRDQSGPFVLINRALAATQAVGGRAEVTFTAAAWEELWAAHERLCPELAIVGWYHTHPGLGVFLSAPDRFIHQHFFPAGFHLALVYDPADFAWGVFAWEGESLRAVRGLYLYTETGSEHPDLAQALRDWAAEGIMAPEDQIRLL